MTPELLTDATAAPPAAAPAAGTAPAAPAPATPAPTDWRAGLPDDLKGHKTLEKFKDPAALAKSYIQMESFRGRSVVIPAADAPPEEQADFYKKLGVPETSDAYKIEPPQGQQFHPELVKSAQQMFHALKLTPQQAQGLLHYYTGTLANNTDQIEKLRIETTSALKGEWGGAFDYNLTRADGTAMMIDRQSGAGLMPVLKATGLVNHPAVIKHYHWLAKQFAEDGDLAVEASGLVGPAEARQQIQAIRANREHPFHRGDKDAVAEMHRLYEIVAAGG